MIPGRVREGLFEKLRKAVRAGDKSYRNQLICRLVQSSEVSLEEIGAACGGLTRQRISQIAAEGRAPVARKGGVQGRAQEMVAMLALEEERVAEVLSSAAVDPRFWAGGQNALRRHAVLRELGLPPSFSKRVREETWRQLVDGGTIEERRKVEIILHYGLGLDPGRFLRKAYLETRGATIADVAAKINDMARRGGLLTISPGGLALYMREMGIERKPKGHRYQ